MSSTCAISINLNPMLFGFLAVIATHICSVNAAGMVVDATTMPQEKEGKEETLQCLNYLYGEPDRNVTSLHNVTLYEKMWQSTPSYRFVGICPDDPSMVGILLEMQAQFSVLYKDKEGKVSKHCFPFAVACVDVDVG